MAEQVVGEVSNEEQEVIDKYQMKRRKTLSLVIPTVITGMAISVYGGVQMYRTRSNPPLEVQQHRELIKESESIGTSLNRLDSINETNKDLKNSLDSLVTEYRTREKTLKSEIAKAEEIDEVKSYNRNFLIEYLVAVGGAFLVGATLLGYSFHALNEKFRKKRKLIDMKYERDSAILLERLAETRSKDKIS